MLLFAFILPLAFSAEPTVQQTAVMELSESFLVSHRSVNIGCDTDPIAAQVPELQERWSPLCSHGTLTDVSNMLVFSAYRFNTDSTVSDYAYKESSRRYLSSPEHVRKSYRDLRPFVLGSLFLADDKKVDELRGYLTTTLIPDFTRVVSPELRGLWLAEAAANEAMMASRVYDGTRTTWDPVLVKAYTAANLAFGTAALAEGFRDPMAVQWRLRRENEGGQALVDAYRKIFIDLAKII